MSSFEFPRWTGRALVALVAIAALLVVFRLGTQASAGVALNDPVVWMEDGARGRLLQINGSTQEITAQVEVGEDGDSLVAIPQGQDAVFLNRTTGIVGVVGAISLAIDSEDAGPGDAGLTEDNVQLLANHQGSSEWSNAYIVGDQRTLVYEPGQAIQSEIRIPESNGALTDTVVNAEGELVAITGDSSQVVYSTDLGLEQLVSLPPLISENAARPGLVRAGESVYVVDSARRVLNELTVDDELGEGVPICGSPGDVQIAGNYLTASDGTHRVLVHDGLAGQLSVVEPQENECRVLELEDTGTNWGAPVAVDATGYLPNYDTGEIVVVDLVDRVVTDTFKFRPSTGKPFELEVFDGAVWANEPDGFRAAIVTSDELVPISKLGAVVFGGDDAEGTGPGAFTRGSDDEEEEQRVFDDEAPAFTIDPDGNGSAPDDVAVDNEQLVESPNADEVVDVDGSNDDPDDAADAPDPADTDEPTDTVPPPVDDALPPEFIDPDQLQELPQAPVEPILVEQDAEPDETAEPLADELIANFVFSSDTINVGEEVRLSDDSTGDPTSWSWTFGDGTSASGPEVTKVWDSEGIYTVTLFASNIDRDISQQTHDFTVIAEDVQRVPSAGFTLSSDIVEVGETVTFTDTSTGDPDTLLWEFGDDSTGSGPVASHSYDEPGVYTVTLTASNEAGPNSVTTQVTVVASVEPPQAVIAPFPGVVEVGQTVTLESASTNTPTATSWDFGDGDEAVGETVRHAWDRPGEYRIRLSVSNSAGSSDTIAVVVVEARVNPPIARFSETSLTIVQGEEIRFSDLSLNAPTLLEWDFGDNSTATGANVGHSWDAPGTYTVTLTATNDAGSDELSKTITVDPIPVDPPSAAFTASASTTQVNSVIVFTDTSIGSPNSWSWNFGDGNTSTAQNPTHSYDAPGTYTVSLTAGNDGGSDSATTTIVVIDPPVASFTFTDTELDVVFADTSQNGPTSWAWSFGDGQTSTLQNPTHSYATPGSYPVTLIATNDAGDSIPFSTMVDVDKAPTAAFSVSTGGLTAQFADASIDGPASWSWDLGDGTTSSQQSPTHTYTSSDSYDVTLTVTNTAGSDSVTQTVTVALAPPEANITCNVVGGGVSCDGTSSTSAVSYAWSAPGSITQSGTSTPNATFSYPTTGSYDITLTVENVEGAGDSSTTTVSVTVPEPPEITALAVSSNNNGVVQLAASALNSPTSWNWDTPGGTITAGAGTSSPTITYTTSGSKTVTVTASNGVGTSAPDSASFTVSIAVPPTITGITANNNQGVVALSAAVTNGPVTYAWSTSGGTLSSTTDATPTLTVPANGPYTVTLTVDNGDGTDTDSTTFTVNDIPDPPPVVSPVSVGPEGPAGSVTVSATATNNPTTWTWSVPGSVQGTITGPSSSPTFTFTANNTYFGTVTASNGTTSNTVNFQIDINGFVVLPPAPTANFTFAVAGTTADFTFTGNDTDPGNTTYSWSFTGGTPAASGNANPAGIDFGGPGTYSVTLTVSNAGGSDSSTQSVTIP